ncbi:GtrA family protein [Leifsonia sp. NPDC080035]|uniref:GtrA family protein n=1 Tax=Leifsonia sp. NPDC080035 TaxID=3143936 RepID=A0AAU7GFC9_9MICO
MTIDREHVRQGLVFLAVGGASALIDAGVFWLLVTLGVWPTLASVISFLTAFVVNYRGNRDLVFRARASKGALVRYSILVVVNLGLSAGGVALGTEVIGLAPIVAKVATMVLVAVINFFVMRLWVFRHGGAAAESAPSTGTASRG